MEDLTQSVSVPEVRTGKNPLLLKAISELLNSSFFIPYYQRGYRWQPKYQVKPLLEDIWNFSLDPGNPDAFYCLQPVVVKPRGDKEFELIDGQQRLTTILLILHYFNETEFKLPKKHYSLSFETRIAQEDFLSSLSDEEKAAGNVDLFHLHQAYAYICKWFELMEAVTPSVRSDFYSKLVNKTKVIWYEINDDSSVIDIFTRLNIGKIPLTNAELVKALFLSRSSVTQGSEGKALKQISIATEWDRIEQTLQRPDFWYFICERPNDYDTRIEYIFDLLKEKKPEDERYFTFHKFYEQFEKQKNDPRSIDNLWLEIKQFFLAFEEWYQDRELYHLVGYLVSAGKKIPDIKILAHGVSKSRFKQQLRTMARKTVAKDVGELDYNDNKAEVRKALLLFNVLTIINNEKSSIRFPFHYYHKQRWDIEHIRSRTSKDISGRDKQNWAATVLEYFSGVEVKEDTVEAIRTNVESLGEQEKDFCASLLTVWLAEDKDDVVFKRLFDDLSIYFDEKDSIDDEDNLSNLTLLDEATNRMYKNAFFPVKRKHILNKEKTGVFIPLCTKNVFLKAYSKKLGELMYWNESDGEDYLNEIIETLK